MLEHDNRLHARPWNHYNYLLQAKRSWCLHLTAVCLKWMFAVTHPQFTQLLPLPVILVRSRAQPGLVLSSVSFQHILEFLSNHNRKLPLVIVKNKRNTSKKLSLMTSVWPAAPVSVSADAGFERLARFVEPLCLVQALPFLCFRWEQIQFCFIRWFFLDS